MPRRTRCLIPALFVPPLLLGLCVACAAALWTNRAVAWLETHVRSDVASVELARDGSAVVRHEMTLRVRGGPLKELTLAGIDEDAVPLDEANIVRAKSGQRAGHPIPLVLEREGDQLHLALTYKKGVRTGTYLVQFAYRTELRSRGLLVAGPAGAVLTWTSPRFQDGIDSLKARFIAPSSHRPPRPITEEPFDSTSGAVSLAATEHGVYLAELHRQPEQDILELTRPHAAKNEQVSWGLVLDPALFGLESKADEASRDTPPPSASAPVRPGTTQSWLWAIALLAGVLYSLMVVAKHRGLVRAGRSGTGVRFLVRLPLWLRAPLLCSGVCAAIVFGLLFERATASALVLGTTMLLAMQLPAPTRPGARGPGRWEVVDLDEATWNRRSGPQGWVRALDAGTLPGFLLFLVLEGAIIVLALRSLGVAPYRSAALLAFSAGLAPIFYTLGQSQIGHSMLDIQRDALLGIVAALRKRGIAFTVLGRVANARSATDPRFDEYRLDLPVACPRSGLVHLRLAIELIQGSWFLIPNPVFIASVADGSSAHAALPRNANWSRGRSRDERIALLRPRLPSTAPCVDLAFELIQKLTEPTPKASKPKARATPHRLRAAS